MKNGGGGAVGGIVAGIEKESRSCSKDIENAGASNCTRPDITG
jgi:hypothetical protein